MPPARAHARATILTCTWLCHAARCTLGKYSAARGRSAVARKCRDKLVPSRTTRRWRVRSATPRPPSRPTASPRSPRTAVRASPSAQAQWPCVAAESGRARRAVRAERTRLTDRRCGSRAARHTTTSLAGSTRALGFAQVSLCFVTMRSLGSGCIPALTPLPPFPPWPPAGNSIK